MPLDMRRGSASVNGHNSAGSGGHNNGSRIQAPVQNMPPRNAPGNNPGGAPGANTPLSGVQPNSNIQATPAAAKQAINSAFNNNMNAIRNASSALANQAQPAQQGPAPQYPPGKAVYYSCAVDENGDEYIIVTEKAFYDANGGLEDRSGPAGVSAYHGKIKSAMIASGARQVDDSIFCPGPGATVNNIIKNMGSYFAMVTDPDFDEAAQEMFD